MITAHGKDYEFSEPARQWIKQRIATFDVSTRRDRHQSTWWEDTNSASSLALMQSLNMSPSNTLSSIRSVGGRPAAISGEVPKLTLAEVMSMPHLVSDFKEALEDGYGSHNVDFIESVQAWQTDVSEIKDPKERESMLYDGASSIYMQFLNKDTALDNLINIPDDVTKSVVSKLAQVFKKGKAKADYSLLTTEIFAEAIAACQAYIAEALWPDFILTDDYTLLCTSHAEALAASAAKQAAAAKRAAEGPTSGNVLGSEMKSGGQDYLSSVARIPYGTLYKTPFPSWVNTRGWQSLNVTVHGARGPIVQGKNAASLYLLVSSGSRIFKGAQSNGAWDETFSLPVYAFTPYATVAVCIGNKCMGFVPLAMSELNANPTQATQKWFPLRTEENPGPSVGPGLTPSPAAAAALAAAFSGSSSSSSSSSATSGLLSPVVLPDADGSSPSPSPLAVSGTAAGIPAPTPMAGAGSGAGAFTSASASGSTSTSISANASLANYESEICLSWTLSEEEAPATMEKYKTIYADETATGGLGDFIRGKVSKKKKRFADDNFNLDLTYIAPNVIAMGFPSEGAEGVYRNPLKQVQQFFLLRHPNHFRIYNLCSERAYDHAKFDGRVAHFPFDDHNPPPFTLIKQFCEDARSFLDEHPQNVISVHCKAGKGRTGTMIASYFVYAGVGNSNETLLLFGKQRTSNSKGVTIPSQIRYVHYFDNYCSLRRAQKPAPGHTTLFLNRIFIRNVGKTYAGSDVYFTILHPSKDREEAAVGENNKERMLTSRNVVRSVYDKTTDSFLWDFSKKLIDLTEDFRLEFSARTSFGREKLFQCWFNTRFIRTDMSSGEPRLIVPKKDLDKACKDTKHKKYSPDMHLEIVFSNMATATHIKETELTANPEARPGSPSLSSSSRNSAPSSSTSTSTSTSFSSSSSSSTSGALAVPVSSPPPRTPTPGV